MLTLLHHPLSASSRMARIALAEKNQDFVLEEQRYWDRSEDLLETNPAGEIPILITDKGKAICGAMPICEYLEDTVESKNLMGRQPLARAETRRLVEWFNTKFYNEVTKNLVWEKFFKKLESNGYPNSKALSAGRTNIHYHLDYIGFLTQKQRFLNGEELTAADIAAAAQLSVLDYYGDVPWDYNTKAKQWYLSIKARQSFKPLLEDKVAGVAPVRHYSELDAA